MSRYVMSQEELAISLATLNPEATKSPPLTVTTETEAANLIFKPYGPQQTPSGWQFNYGWSFEVPAMGVQSNLLAISNGVLHFSPPVGGNQPVLALRLSGFETAALFLSGMPKWIPAPLWILYRNVDVSSVQQTLKSIFDGNLTLLVTLWKAAGNTGTPSSAVLANSFVNQPSFSIPGGIPIKAGSLLGKGALMPGNGNRRVFELVFTQVWPGSGLVENPAYYFNFWADLQLIDLSGHPFETQWLRVDQGLQGNGVLRFVSQTNGADSNAPFDDPTRPASTLGAAVTVSNNADTVVILDSGIYQEQSELFLTKGINITSHVLIPPLELHLGGGVNPSSLSFPIIQGGESYVAIRDDMVGDKNVKPTASGHRVLRYDLEVSASIASLTKVVIRYGGAREGGGIYVVRNSPVVIACCHIHRNIAYFNISPPHTPFPGAGWFEEGSGGGIGIYKASPLIWGNLIERNLANYGGGIGLFAWCYPTIRENIMLKNAGPDWFSLVTITDGGAIRILQQSLRFETLPALKAAVPPGTPLSPRLLQVAQMYDPAQLDDAKRNWIFLLKNQIISNIASDDGGGVYATAVARIFSRENIITNNVARRGDGGGIRISTASTLRSINDIVSQNIVQGPSNQSAVGGGIAVRASNLYLLGSRVDGNSNDNFAGGGIAFTATREGDVSIGISVTARAEGYEIPSWDDQRRNGLKFDAVELQIEGTCFISNNLALGTVSGKGAGIYIFRLKDSSVTPPFEGDRMNITIENVAIVISPTNTSGFQDTTGVKPFDRILLIDQTRTLASNPSLVFQLGDSDLQGLVDLSHISN